jgi:hypothetical protein
MPYKFADFLSIDFTDERAASNILMNDDGQGRKFLWNVNKYRPDYTVSPPCQSNRHGHRSENLKSDKALRVSHQLHFVVRIKSTKLQPCYLFVLQIDLSFTFVSIILSF